MRAAGLTETAATLHVPDIPTYRWAIEDDIPAIAALIARAIGMLQRDMLIPAQLAASP